MQTTNNLGLKKPGAEDVVNIEDLNSNSDVLDGKFGASSGHGHTGAAGDGPKIGSNGLAAGAATDTVIGSRTVSDSTAPTGDSGTPTTLFGWLANMIKAITGGATWRTLPGMTIAAIKTILDAATNAGTASTLMKRDASGRAQVAAPSAAADIVNKVYVDNSISDATTAATVLTKIKSVDGVGSGLDADLLGGKAASDYALFGNNETYLTGVNGADIAYVKIAEMTTNIGSGGNGLIVLVTGLISIGSNRPGMDVLQMSTRTFAGSPTLMVTQLTPAFGGEAAYGLVVNATSGMTELWMRRPGYCHPTKLTVTMKLGSSGTVNCGFLSAHTTTMPTGWTEVPRTKLDAASVTGYTFNQDVRNTAFPRFAGMNLNGNLLFDQAGEFTMRKNRTGSNWGFYINDTGMGLYNWDTSKIALAYDGATNTLKTNVTSVVTNWNAEMVGGKKATDFAPSGFGLGGVGRRLPTGTDLNTLRDNGYYDVQNPANGVNGLTWHNVHVFCSGDTNYVTQIAFGMIEEYDRAYSRSCSSGSWTPWKRILNQDDYSSLFQYANDGKTAVANAITAKGVSASPSETFAALAGKIGRLSNVKRASGSILLTSSLPWEIYKAGASAPMIEVTGLGFRPNLILINENDSANIATIYWWNNLAYENGAWSGNSVMFSTRTSGVSQSSGFLTTNLYYTSGYAPYVNDGGFKLPVIAASGWYADWVAIGW